MASLFSGWHTAPKVSIEQAARQLAPEYLAAKESREKSLENVDLIMYSAANNFSRSIRLRTLAGSLAVLAGKSGIFARSISVPEGKTLEESILGRQAKMFGIYDRDLGKDMNTADGMLRKMKLIA